MTDITMKQGNDLRVIVRVLDQNGIPVDISGATQITWAVADTVDATTNTLTKTMTGGDITITGVDGFTFDITQADSAALALQSYYHEALVITAGGEAYTSLTGSLTIQPALLQP